MGASPSVQHILDLGSAASGIVYNDVTDETPGEKGKIQRECPPLWARPLPMMVSKIIAPQVYIYWLGHF